MADMTSVTGMTDVTPTRFPVVGRDAERAALRTRVAAAARGTGGCVVVEGSPGIGKSRLLDEVITEARQAGLAVAQGRAAEVDRVAPLSTLAGALRDSDPPVIGADGLADPAWPRDGRYLLIDRLSSLIANYCKTRPLVIVLDDAQWMDELTMLALRIIVPELRSLPLLWLLARRPSSPQAQVARTVDWLLSVQAEAISLGPLGAADMAQLCVNIVGCPPSVGVIELLRSSGGNPFLIEELLVSLRETGRIRIADGVAEMVPGSLPDTFVEAVDRRLLGLSPEARRLLEVGSVLGRPFGLHVAAGLLDRPAMTLVGPVKEAVWAGVLEDHGATLAFRHDLIRDAVYGGLPGSVRQALHREAVPVLRREGYPVAEVAEHLLRGAQRADSAALLLFHEALAQVAPTAPGAAADLTLRMLGLLDKGDRRRPRLIGQAVRLLASSGQLDEARRLGEAYLSCGLDAASEGSILLGLADALKHAGQDHVAAEYARRGLARGGLPAADRARMLSVRAHALAQLGDLPGADAAALEAIDLGRAVGDSPAVIAAGTARSVVQYAHGELAAAVAHASDAVAAANAAGGEALQQHPRLWLGRALIALGDISAAEATLAADKRLAEELGTMWSRPAWHYYAAEAKLAAGHLDEARAEAETGIQLADQLGAQALVPSLLAALGLIELMSSGPDAALGYLRRARRHAVGGMCAQLADILRELAVREDSAGRVLELPAPIARLYDSLAEQPYPLVHEPLLAPRMVRMAMQAHDRDRALTVVKAARAVAARNPGASALDGSALHAGALLAGDLEAFRAALRAQRDGTRPLSLAAALADTGDAEQAAGNTVRAVRLFDEACDILDASGAGHEAEAVRRRLRPLRARHPSARISAEPGPGRSRRPGPGSRQPQSGKAGPAKAGWDSLTPAELRIARLVAEGRTNREIAVVSFLSPHTVDSHIRHAFSKLGISSRVDLTRLVLLHDV